MSGQSMSGDISPLGKRDASVSVDCDDNNDAGDSATDAGGHAGGMGGLQRHQNNPNDSDNESMEHALQSVSEEAMGHLTDFIYHGGEEPYGLV